MIQVSELVAIDKTPNSWRLHVRTAPNKRYKVTHLPSLEIAVSKVLEMHVADCKSLDELPALLSAFKKDIVAQIVRQAPRREFNDLNADERLVLLARGRPAFARCLCVEGGRFVERAMPKVAGMVIDATPFGGARETTDDAKLAAQQFRDLCRDKAKQQGLI